MRSQFLTDEGCEMGHNRMIEHLDKRAFRQWLTDKVNLITQEGVSAKFGDIISGADIYAKAIYKLLA